jgi:hypothetical protein
MKDNIMTNISKKIVLLTILFTVAPAHTKQVSRATTTPKMQPAPIIPIQPIQPIIVKPKPTPIQLAPIQPIVIQQPTLTRNNTWTSSAGLIYKSNKGLSNRINHVLAHAKADPTKATHSVFSIPEDQILDLVDEAWRNRGEPRANPKGKGDEYIIEMERMIGTKGETKIQINTFKDTSEIVTAYPVK